MDATLIKATCRKSKSFTLRDSIGGAKMNKKPAKNEENQDGLVPEPQQGGPVGNSNLPKGMRLFDPFRVACPQKPSGMAEQNIRCEQTTQ
jgi:hypothetical protein